MGGVQGMWLRRFLALSRRYLELDARVAESARGQDVVRSEKEWRAPMSEYRHQIIVAAVLERNGRFLLVEELVEGEPRLNQPAGRLEAGESPEAGAARETLEESGYHFVPTSLIGLYEWYDRRHGAHYLRLAYAGKILDQGEAAPTDPHIIATHWLTPGELAARGAQLRSPYVLQCVHDYLDPGRRYPLDLVRHFDGGQGTLADTGLHTG